MTLTIHLPENLEAALKEQAIARGISPADYVREIVEHHLALPPFKTGHGMLAKYGPAPSAEEIDANRAEMFRHFAED